MPTLHDIWNTSHNCKQLICQHYMTYGIPIMIVHNLQLKLLLEIWNCKQTYMSALHDIWNTSYCNQINMSNLHDIYGMIQFIVL